MVSQKFVSQPTKVCITNDVPYVVTYGSFKCLLFIGESLLLTTNLLKILCSKIVKFREQNIENTQSAGTDSLGGSMRELREATAILFNKAKHKICQRRHFRWRIT